MEEKLNSTVNQSDSQVRKTNGITLSWENVNVYATDTSKKNCLNSLFCNVNINAEKKHLVKDVNGIAKPGELLVIMGASGSGKTSLLNALTFRTQDNLSSTGDVTLNGQRIQDAVSLASVSAYVEQEESFIGTLSVYEHLKFQAMLRMKKGTTSEEREQRIQEVLLELNLKKCEFTLIGAPTRMVNGISGGEKRRLQFGTEIITNPGILFCDEPISGLDSYMASTIVESMKTLARNGRTIISTIHQPSSDLVFMFDKLYLLAEGRLAFTGTLSQAHEYFGGLGFECPENYNPLEFYIKKISIDPNNRAKGEERTKRICDEFESNGSLLRLNEDIQSAKVMSQRENDKINLSQKFTYKTNSFVQIRWLIWREVLAKARNPLASKIKVLQSIMLAVIFGLIYWRQDLTDTSVQNISGVIFLCITSMTMSNLFPALQTFATEIPMFLKENKIRMYRVINYFMSKILIGAIDLLILPFIFISIVYWMANLNNDWQRYLICAGVSVMVGNVAVSFAELISSIAPSIGIAMAIGGSLISPLMIFGGSFLNNNSVPVYFIWLKYISWLGYANEILSVNQWSNIEHITCNSNITCRYRTGDDVLEALNMKESKFNLDLIYIAVIYFSCRVLTYFFLSLRSYRNRK